jgi:hypothetical protein
LKLTPTTNAVFPKLSKSVRNLQTLAELTRNYPMQATQIFLRNELIESPGRSFFLLTLISAFQQPTTQSCILPVALLTDTVENSDKSGSQQNCSTPSLHPYASLHFKGDFFASISSRLVIWLFLGHQDRTAQLNRSEHVYQSYKRPPSPFNALLQFIVTCCSYWSITLWFCKSSTENRKFKDN